MGRKRRTPSGVAHYRTFEPEELQVGQLVRLDPLHCGADGPVFEFGTVEALRDGRTADVVLERRRNPFVRITALGVRVRAICCARET